MKTQSAKSKGRRLQQHVARRIAEELDLPEDDVVSRPMGSGGEDIMLSAWARKFFPFSVECKNTKSFPGPSAVKQAKANARCYTPIVCWKPPRKSYDDTLVFLPLDDFLSLWRKVIGKDEEEEEDNGIKAGESQTPVDDHS